MSVQSELQRIRGNINNAYTAILNMGGTVPSILNSSGLEDAIKTIPCSGLHAVIEGATVVVKPIVVAIIEDNILKIENA